MDIIGKRKYTYIVSIILTVLSLGALLAWGLNLGIDFKGGTMMEVQFSKEETTEQSTPGGENPENQEGNTENQEQTEFKSPAREEISQKLSELGLQSLNIQESDNNVVILRYIGSDESANEKVMEKLGEFDGKVEQLRVDFVGASVSKQLKKNAIMGAVLAVIGIALYIAWAFRKVSFPVNSWQYGVSAIVALVHDIFITIGVFAVLGKFFDVEIGVSFIAALLTILGYSVNDTIVVYDRIRENLIKSSAKENFEDVVNRSIGETLARSINTSLTVIIVLIVIVLFGGESIKYFSLALLIGVTLGTLSSIFVAAALLVSSYNWKLKRVR